MALISVKDVWYNTDAIVAITPKNGGLLLHTVDGNTWGVPREYVKGFLEEVCSLCEVHEAYSDARRQELAEQF